jgi:hypothetical protein
MRKGGWRELAAVLRFLRIIADCSVASANRAGDHPDRLWWQGRADGLVVAIQRIERAINRAKGKP